MKKLFIKCALHSEITEQLMQPILCLQPKEELKRNALAKTCGAVTRKRNKHRYN